MRGAREDEVDSLALVIERFGSAVDISKPVAISQGLGMRITGQSSRAAYKRKNARLAKVGAITLAKGKLLRAPGTRTSYESGSVTFAPWVLAALGRDRPSEAKEWSKKFQEESFLDLQSSLRPRTPEDRAALDPAKDLDACQDPAPSPGQERLAAAVERIAAALERMVAGSEVGASSHQANAYTTSPTIQRPWSPTDSAEARRVADACEAILREDSGSFPGFMARLRALDFERVRFALNHVRIDQASGGKPDSWAAVLVSVAEGKTKLREGASCPDEIVEKQIEDARREAEKKSGAVAPGRRSKKSLEEKRVEGRRADARNRQALGLPLMGEDLELLGLAPIEAKPARTPALAVTPAANVNGVRVHDGGGIGDDSP